jgi:hypothetical protein
MPLNKAQLQLQIIQILNDFENEENVTGEQAKLSFSEKLANAIDAFVRTGTVMTTGTATSQTGTIT